MKFVLIDKITALDSGKSLTAVKSVSLAEEYLADHFPAFPVLPGVLLLEGLIESASWLVREHQKFFKQYGLARMRLKMLNIRVSRHPECRFSTV